MSSNIEEESPNQGFEVGGVFALTILAGIFLISAVGFADNHLEVIFRLVIGGLVFFFGVCYLTLHRQD